MIAWKGSLSEEESSDADFAASELQMSPPLATDVSDDLVRGADRRQLIVSEKLAATPDRYPRRPGIAKKRPLAANKG